MHLGSDPDPFFEALVKEKYAVVSFPDGDFCAYDKRSDVEIWSIGSIFNLPTGHPRSWAAYSVYMLIWSKGEAPTECYVGQTNDFSRRIVEHQKKFEDLNDLSRIILIRQRNGVLCPNDVTGLEIRVHNLLTNGGIVRRNKRKPTSPSYADGEYSVIGVDSLDKIADLVLLAIPGYDPTLISTEAVFEIKPEDIDQAEFVSYFQQYANRGFLGDIVQIEHGGHLYDTISFYSRVGFFLDGKRYPLSGGLPLKKSSGGDVECVKEDPSSDLWKSLVVVDVLNRKKRRHRRYADQIHRRYLKFEKLWLSDSSKRVQRVLSSMTLFNPGVVNKRGKEEGEKWQRRIYLSLIFIVSVAVCCSSSLCIRF